MGHPGGWLLPRVRVRWALIWGHEECEIRHNPTYKPRDSLHRIYCQIWLENKVLKERSKKKSCVCIGHTHIYSRGEQDDTGELPAGVPTRRKSHLVPYSLQFGSTST